jgi:hypothetical protein
MQLVMENITCLPIIVLFYNGSNNVQQSLEEVIWFNIPIYIYVEENMRSTVLQFAGITDLFHDETWCSYSGKYSN